MKSLLVLASLLLPTTAFAAQHLECVESGFTPAQRAAIDRHIATFDFATASGLPQDFVDAVGDRAQMCARAYHWSAAAAEQARRYGQTSLVYAALARHIPFPPAQLAALRRNYAAAGAQARRVLTEITDAGYAQRAPNLAPQDGMALAQLLSGTGIPASGPQAQYAGGILINLMGIDLARSRFAAL